MTADLDAARRLLRKHLGADWELALIAADAMPATSATLGDVLIAQQRAVELVSDTLNDWCIDTRDSVAAAWQVVWLNIGR